jgi:hypothetical protein
MITSLAQPTICASTHSDGDYTQVLCGSSQLPESWAYVWQRELPDQSGPPLWVEQMPSFFDDEHMPAAGQQIK